MMKKLQKRKIRKNLSANDAKRVDEDQKTLKDINAKLNQDLDSLTVNVTDGRQLAQSLADYSKTCENSLLSDSLNTVANFHYTLEDMKLRLCSLILEKFSIPLGQHITDIKQVSKRQHSKQILERMENGKYDNVSRLCDYLEEYHTFFTKGRDKLSELMPVIARYRNKIKEFFDEKSRVESDGDSAEEEGEDKNGDVSLNDFLKTDPDKTRSPAGERKADKKKDKRERIKSVTYTEPVPLVEEKPKEKVFGEELAVLLKRENSTVPVVVEKIVDYLDSTALDIVGIFRISGFNVQIQSYRDDVDAGKSIDLPNDPKYVHMACGLLKLYLRALPDPLMTFERFDQFVDVNKQVIESKKFSQLKDLIESLPAHNAHLLDYLISFCVRVADHSDKNMMSVKNLASLIAPNILYRKDPNPVTLLEDINYANLVVELLMEHYEKLFENIKYDKKKHYTRKPVVIEQVDSAFNTPTLTPVASGTDISEDKSASNSEPNSQNNVATPHEPSTSPPSHDNTATPAGSAETGGSSKIGEIKKTFSTPNEGDQPKRRTIWSKPAVSKKPKPRASALINLKLNKEEDFTQVIDELFNKNSYDGWLIMGFAPGKSTEIELQSKGRGTIAEMIEHLKDDEMQFILIRLTLPEMKGGAVSTRDVFIEWNGPNVAAIDKGKKKSLVGEIKELLQPYHAELTAISKQNFNLEVVLDRSAPFSGSHVID